MNFVVSLATSSFGILLTLIIVVVAHVSFGLFVFEFWIRDRGLAGTRALKWMAIAVLTCGSLLAIASLGCGFGWKGFCQGAASPLGHYDFLYLCYAWILGLPFLTVYRSRRHRLIQS